MYVNANFYKDATRVGSGVRYISHREEQLPDGTTRPLYGLGPRYRELQGDEPALVRRLREDAAGLKEPHFFRLKMTVDDDLAGRITTLPLRHSEWAVRDAVERTFRGAFRQAQGVFVVHYHGGRNRPRGHPHVHVQLSPRLQDGAALKFIPRDRLAAFKKRWEREIQIAVRSHERRALVHPDRGLRPRRLPSWSEFLMARAIGRVGGQPARQLLQAQAYARALTRGRVAGVLGRVILKAAVPAPIRAALDLGLTISRFR
jgi:hypothetical protein